MYKPVAPGGLTEATVDDATTAITLIGEVYGAVASVTADTAYDTIAFYKYGHGSGRDRRGSTGQDRNGIRTQTAVQRA